MTWLQHNWLTVATIAYFALPALGHLVGLFSPEAGSVLEAIGADYKKLWLTFRPAPVLPAPGAS